MPVDASHFLSEDYLSGPANSREPEEVFEPFDARKRARVEALTAEEEDLLRDIAALKKSIPGTVASAWAEAVRKGIKDDEETLERVNGVVTAQFGKNPTAASGESATATATEAAAASESESSSKATKKEVANGSGLVIMPLERQDEVETSFEAAVRGLGRLKKEMPAVVARMERARKAGEYVITER
jgi:kinetochor protein Mis14/NSL1